MKPTSYDHWLRDLVEELSRTRPDVRRADLDEQALRQLHASGAAADEVALMPLLPLKTGGTPASPQREWTNVVRDRAWYERPVIWGVLGVLCVLVYAGYVGLTFLSGYMEGSRRESSK